MVDEGSGGGESKLLPRHAARLHTTARLSYGSGRSPTAVYAAETVQRFRRRTQRSGVFDAPGGADEATVLAPHHEQAEIKLSLRPRRSWVTDLVLKATSDLFDTLGASATSRAKALDRHWRNARTVSSHNPRILKARVVGGYAVNGTPPPYAWAIGTTSRTQDWAEPS